MDLAPSAEQQARALAVAELLAKHASPERVRAAEPLGFDGPLWQHVSARNWPDLDALLDLALVAEEMGRHLAPAPFVEVAVSRRLLRAAGVDVGVGDATITTLALHDSSSGVARLVPAGAVADAVVALRHGELVVVPIHGARPGAPVSNLGCLPIADCPVDGSDATQLMGADRAGAAHTRAVDEWRVLTASALVGLAAGALDLAVNHVTHRHQFGVPVGSFQAVQHRLADLATDLEGARLLARKAAWSADQRASDAPALAAMAFVWAAGAAHRVTTDSLHFHGGYGYTLENDIQLSFRRAKAWALVLDDPERELSRLGDTLYAVVG
ncbi:MAG: acyl-CoA dehydrogenase protein [Acidimicrobiales bacterium]|jgi:hypothetical protein|nr:acyl-CoA dehydrogenase protein [Acidimicrobiales bacterium]